MVSTVQAYSVNDRIMYIDLAHDVKELSDPSRKILAVFDKKLPRALCSATDRLQNEIRSLPETAQMLQEANDKHIRNKTIALLKTTLIVIVVAGALIGIAIGGDEGKYVGGFVGGAIYFILTQKFYHTAKKEILTIEEKIPTYKRGYCWWEENEGYDFEPICLPPCGGGLVLPLYEAFTRQERLKRVLNEQTRLINTELEDYQRVNAELLPQAYRFYKTESSELLLKLDEEIAQFQRSLNAMLQFPNRSLAGEKELQTQITTRQIAKNELKVVIEFYKLFDQILEEGKVDELPLRRSEARLTIEQVEEL